jgi:hypothetical protein
MPDEPITTPLHVCAPPERGAPEEYYIPISPPAKLEFQPKSSKLIKNDKKAAIGYYVIWSLVFFGIWMLLTFGTIFVAAPLTALSVIIGSAVDSADRKKRKQDV